MDPVKLYDYLALARERIFSAIRPLDDAAYRRELGIGLGSIARTLHHCRAAEGLYMRRISGDTGVPPALSEADTPEITSGRALPFDELERLWLETTASTRSGLARAVGAGWSDRCRIESFWDGRSFTYEASPGDFFCQLVVHEVHHRAQVVHMLSRLGVPVGEIDYSMLMFLPTLPEG